MERFDPPEEFVARRTGNDPAIYEEAERDPEAWWAKLASDLHWFEPWDTVLDDSGAPFYTWFAGGKINASYNCLDRHVEAGLGDRVAFPMARGRRRGARRHLRPACSPTCSASPTR